MNLNKRKEKRLPASTVSVKRLQEMLLANPKGKQAAKIRKELAKRQSA